MRYFYEQKILKVKAVKEKFDITHQKFLDSVNYFMYRHLFSDPLSSNIKHNMFVVCLKRHHTRYKRQREKIYGCFSHVAYCLGVTDKKKSILFRINAMPELCSKCSGMKGHLTSLKKRKMRKVMRLLGNKSTFLSLEEWIGQFVKLRKVKDISSRNNSNPKGMKVRNTSCS